MTTSFFPLVSEELTEAAHVRAGSSERAQSSVPEEGERGSPRSGNSGGTPLREELAEDPVPEEEIEPVPEEVVDPVPEQEAESVPEEEVDPIPEQEAESVPEEVDPVPEQEAESVLEEDVDPVPEQEAESVPEEDVDPVPEQEAEPVPEEEEELIPEEEGGSTPHGSQSSELQPAAPKTTSRRESQVRVCPLCVTIMLSDCLHGSPCCMTAVDVQFGSIYSYVVNQTIITFAQDAPAWLTSIPGCKSVTV